MKSALTVLIIVVLATGVALAVFDPFYAMIAVVTAAALLMGALIMKTSASLIDLECTLSDDAKTVIVSNKGNASIHDIHVALVPLDIEFDITSLEPEADYRYQLASMLREGKAAITYTIPNGAKMSKDFHLVGGRDTEQDLLKPVFPLFNWK